MFPKAILIAGLLAFTASTAWADDWRDQMNYPARIAAFNYGSDALDSTHPMRLGSWTIQFGRSLPVMILLFDPGGDHYFITRFPPYQMVCSNAVAGNVGCAIQLVPSQGQYSIAENCRLWIGNDVPLPMPCPTSVTFATSDNGSKGGDK